MDVDYSAQKREHFFGGGGGVCSSRDSNQQSPQLLKSPRLHATYDSLSNEHRRCMAMQGETNTVCTWYRYRYSILLVIHYSKD
jgi:hypothetical protein